MTETDVLIIGAGPAGTAAATLLGQHGIKTTIVDQATFPRDKVCGDGLSGWALSMLKKLDPSLVGAIASMESSKDSWGVRFVSPGLRSLDIPYIPKVKKDLESPAGYTITRLDFDNLLFQSLKKYSSLTLIENVKLSGFHYQNDRLIVKDQRGNTSISAQMVLFANGALSPFDPPIGKRFEDKNHLMAGVRAYYEGITGVHPKNYIELHFLKDFKPGYFWIFPLGQTKCNIGIAMLSKSVVKKKINLNQALNAVIQSKPHLTERFRQAKQLSKIKGFSLPLGSIQRPLSGENFLLLGDAAGLIDPFTGEGIGNALASGYYAAEHVISCLKSNDFSADHNLNYDRTVYNKLGKELKMGKIMQSLLNYPALFNLVVNKASKNPELKRTISSMFNDPSIKEKLKKPSFYFKLLGG